MSGGWTDEELPRVGDAVELDLASERDGQLSGYTTMWVVRVGDDIYIRSAGGPNRPWYRRAVGAGTGRIKAGGIDRDVTFDRPASAPHDSIDAAYHSKYDRYGPGPVSHVTGPGAHPVTIRLVRSGLPLNVPRPTQLPRRERSVVTASRQLLAADEC